MHASFAAFAALTLAGTLHCASAQDQDAPSAPVWIEQDAKTADYAFLVQFQQSERGERNAAQALRVVDRKTGAVLQQIDAINGMALSIGAPLFVRMVDANGDGHPDIQLYFADGGAGPNNSDNFYLFDPAVRQYRLHPGLSELTQAGVDNKGIIHSASRGGCCEHEYSTWRFIKGRLTLLSSRVETATSDDKLEVTTGTLRNGNMHYQTRYRALPEEGAR